MSASRWKTLPAGDATDVITLIYMEWKDINIPEYTGLYRISEHGDVYSTRKQKLLSVYKQGGCYGYKRVVLTAPEIDPKTIYQHILVASHFIGPKPSDKHKVIHKDDDRFNNHYTNLKWVTHSANMIKARQGFSWSPGPPQQAKYKTKMIVLISDTEDIIKDSIKETCEYLGVDRKKFNRYVNSHKTINGFKLRYA